uniref:t-SNARE coiled-coil homology domain-containing protein n=1 Tax=Amphora coffeiformis TaxID=265554 RepID=A0A7S3PAK1_9STRA|mmetsp:Transcript_1777/g.3423  ORF Transcript_1777/g.3423 Transcript_1777/m.3423 type:complete len:259 (-) Transcript_1777:154-930(-)
MSFQDFAGSSKTRQSGRATARPTGSSSSNTASAGGQDSLRPISESLLQYQRHVGILEKIVQSMTATTAKGSNNREADSQYHAQVDVITQLAARVDQQLATAKRQETGAIRTALIKLEGDFRRVKDRVAALQESVSKMRQQSAALKKQQAASAAAMDPNATEESMGYEEFQRHMELQLQQDRLAEQIMREREEEIRKINQGMHQVNEIYKDLAHIVGSQQEHVDAIETQMEESRVNAENGLQQVEKANQQFGSANCIIS